MQRLTQAIEASKKTLLLEQERRVDINIQRHLSDRLTVTDVATRANRNVDIVADMAWREEQCKRQRNDRSPFEGVWDIDISDSGTITYAELECAPGSAVVSGQLCLASNGQFLASVKGKVDFGLGETTLSLRSIPDSPDMVATQYTLTIPKIGSSLKVMEGKECSF